MVNPRKVIADTKVYIARAQVYVQIATSLMVLYLTVDRLGFSGFAIPISILAILVILYVGFMDVKKKIFEEEQRVWAENNPIQMEILKVAKEIREKMNK